MALVIALTGGIGSGKTSVANLLAEFGAAIVDTDEIAHELTAAGQPGAAQIGAEFGAQYLDAAGALDRARMRELVFSDAAAKQRLEAVLHPMIRAEVQARVEKFAASPREKVPYVVIVVPLLIETGAYRDLAQRILVVDSAEGKQVERVQHRSNLDPSAVKAIMANQATREQRLSHADDVVRNDGDLQALHDAAAALHQKYLHLAGNSVQTR